MIYLVLDLSKELLKRKGKRTNGSIEKRQQSPENFKKGNNKKNPNREKKKEKQGVQELFLKKK